MIGSKKGPFWKKMPLQDNFKSQLELQNDKTQPINAEIQVAEASNWQKSVGFTGFEKKI